MYNLTKDYSRLLFSVVPISVISNRYVRVCMDSGEHTEWYCCCHEISVKLKLRMGSLNSVSMRNFVPNIQLIDSAMFARFWVVPVKALRGLHCLEVSAHIPFLDTGKSSLTRGNHVWCEVY